MINKLRFKFIKITMSSVLTVLLLIIATINIVNIIQNNRSVDMVTQMIVDNGGTLVKLDKPFNNDFRDDIKDDIKKEKPDDRFHNREELPFSSRYFTVFLNGNRETVDINTENIASVTESETKEITEAILEKKNSSGWYKTYRYKLAEYGDGYILVVLEATSTKISMFTVLTITLSVGIGSFLIIFLLITLFSKKAIKPIAETYEKQQQFITDASHELKTPLTVVSANNEIIAMTYGENEWCDGIEKQISSMRSLIGKMIEMSKLDENDRELIYEKFNLSDAVYDTVMSFKAAAERNGLSLNINIAPDIIFNGDENAVRHAVAILADNAVKYCDANGEIKIFVSRINSGMKKHILISVENTYAQVETLDTDKIFERFYRADKSRTAQNSFGLGLSIAKSAIEKHGGKIEAKKKKGSIVMEICF